MVLNIGHYQHYKKRKEMKWKKLLDGGINIMHQKQN
jgi:hypothetical protein